MRRLLTILAVFALIVAACGPREADPDETSAGTTSPVAADIELICHGANNYSEEACANFIDAADTAREPDYDPDLTREDLDHSCLVIPSHVFVFPDEIFAASEVPANLGLTPANAEDLQEIGLSQDDANLVIGYLEGVPLGLYVSNQQVDDVLALIDEIESDETLQDEAGPMVDASPHYELIPVDPKWKYGPHSLVQPLSGAWPLDQTWPPDGGQTGPPDGGGRVVIIDTGGIDSTPVDINFQEVEDSNIDSRVAGHGLFAASIVEQFNPMLTIDIYRASSSTEKLNEGSVMAAIQRAQPTNGDVVNLSLGTYPCRDGDPTLGLIQSLSTLDGVLITAASGNDGETHRTMFPAALGFPPASGGFPVLTKGGIDLERLAELVTAVGALDQHGNAVAWSNPAEVYSPGEAVVGYHHKPMGLAAWSGTSFAAPHFAACLASGACTPP